MVSIGKEDFVSIVNKRIEKIFENKDYKNEYYDDATDIKKIDVNKRCFITREDYFPALDNFRDNLDTIINISAFDDKDGFVHFVLNFDMREKCCESFKYVTTDFKEGVYFVESIENSFLTKEDKLKLFKDIDSEYYSRLYAGMESSLNDMIMKVNIKDTEPIYILMRNIHDGFYHHVIKWICLNDEKTIEYWGQV